MKNTCRDIMITDPPKLHPDQTLREAVDTIHHAGMRYLPVVDHDNQFVGIFSSMSLLQRLLPQSLSINMGQSLSDLNFMKTNISELADRLDDIEQESVRDNLFQETVPICSPDDSIMEAIFLLHKYYAHIVVLEPDSKTFLGTISINAILDHVSADHPHS